ncbi:MAG: polymerase LigD, ligase domain protein [Prosthecobacter sp.]|nr:polymerase LigD, ligase domain protein [Prosthecobacter sp.]
MPKPSLKRMPRRGGKQPEAPEEESLAMPAFVEPMKAKPSTELPESEDWMYELKFDGYRCLGAKAGTQVKLWSRAENDFTLRFPAVAEALAALNVKSALVDGELVVADEEGRPSFQLIQNADASTPVRAFLFDLLEVNGRDLRDQPLVERRKRLAALLPKNGATLCFSTELSGPPQQLLAEVAERGLEGLIAKRRDSVYEAGRRSGAWRKIKCNLEQEFVIGGFTAPKGSRSHFGSLLIGYYDGKELTYAGKAGTGFTAKALSSVYEQMLALRVEKCPFKSLPIHGGRWGATLTRDDVAHCIWVKPQLVAQVHFTGWTEDGVLRHPAFLGMREDKRAREVVRET